MRGLIRRFQRLYHRIAWGFPESDLWTLYISLAKWILPRLRKLKQIQHGYVIIPDKGETYKDAVEKIERGEEGHYLPKWNAILDKMILAFEWIAREEQEEDNGKLKREVKEGFDLFHKYFFSLWD